MSVPPPRLAVLAARDASVAVVVRRGPTDWARLSLWDTATDEVEHGGWIHARVPWRRCDLSPDGRLFVAFVADHGRDPDAPLRDTWVAISRPPWWYALALWFNGTTWDCGGFFPTPRRAPSGRASRMRETYRRGSTPMPPSLNPGRGRRGPT